MCEGVTVLSWLMEMFLERWNKGERSCVTENREAVGLLEWCDVGVNMKKVGMVNC